MSPGDAHARVVVVTGANRGIGRELARQLAGRGETVVLGARTEAKAREAAARIEGPSEVVPVALDVTSPDHVDAAAAMLAERFGRVDVLINNAGIHYDTGQTAATADLGIVEEALQTNLIGAWRTCLALLDLLRAAPSPRIVNVSSGAGSLEGMGAGTPAYGVSKAALNALTLKLADDLRGDGMLVNAVCPGWVATDMGGSGGRPVADGAASVLWAADLPDDGPTGGFFRDGRPVSF
jgi:NAD(P)-dependent dehydrogenase (short-subunit alcohol dehydrogenase family)